MTDISDGAKDLVKKMLRVDKNERCELIDCLNHPWIISSRPHSGVSNNAFEPIS